MARRRRLGVPAGSGHEPPRDGVGDLEGIRAHLDHVASLGADAIWLSPFYPSPMADGGYDVADYCDVDPLFGDLDGFDALLDEAHRKGLRVVVDWVPNHTSSAHPWFHAARRSRDDPVHDFYIWRDPDPERPERPPNNWRRAFGEGPAWSFDSDVGQWYLHLFLPEQPDLNWANPAVVAAMEDVLRFWLDRGVDGFRIDVAHGLCKPEGLSDVPAEHAATPYAELNDEESTHAVLRRLRRLADSYAHHPVLIGEVFLLDPAAVGRYYGGGDELHLAFNFAPSFTPFSAPEFRSRLEEIAEHIESRGGWPTWFLSNHDRPRHRSRFGGSEQRARLAAVVSATVRGTLFLYAGEELALEDAVVPPERVVDPGGRDGCRAPIPWTPRSDHGWALGGGEPWLPWPPRADSSNVASESGRGDSVLALYRHALALRRRRAALSEGSLELLESLPEGVLGYRRTAGEDRVLVLANFAPVEVPLPRRLAPDGELLLSSLGGSGEREPGSAYPEALGPEEAVVVSLTDGSPVAVA